MKLFRKISPLFVVLLFNQALLGKVTFKAGNTIIHRHARDGKLEELKKIIKKRRKKNIDINMKNDRQNTPLHEAARKGRVKVIRFLINKFTKTIDIDAQNRNKNTSLHVAALKGRFKTVKVLVNNGADKNLTNKKGKTPLDLAYRSLGRLEKIINFLKEPIKVPGVEGAPPPPPLPPPPPGKKREEVTPSPKPKAERESILEEIKRGVTLRKVTDEEKETKPKEGRESLFEEIQRGVKLRKVTEEEKEETKSRKPTTPEEELAALFKEGKVPLRKVTEEEKKRAEQEKEALMREKESPREKLMSEIREHKK